MKLTFNKIENKYVSEFEVTSDFNLHVERPNGGLFNVYQRTSASGKYAKINEFNTDGKSVIDADFTGIVYPKSIKVVTNVEPVVAEVVTDGEVIPSAGGGKTESTMEYFRAESIKESNLQFFASSLKWHNESANSITIAPATLFAFSDFDESSLIAVGIDFQSEYRMPEPFNGKLIDVLLKMGFLQAEIDSIPRITKEEFYNLN